MQTFLDATQIYAYVSVLLRFGMRICTVALILDLMPWEE